MLPDVGNYKSKRKWLLAVAVWAREEWRLNNPVKPTLCARCGDLFKRYRKDNLWCLKRCYQLDFRQKVRDEQKRRLQHD